MDLTELKAALRWLDSFVYNYFVIKFKEKKKAYDKDY